MLRNTMLRGVFAAFALVLFALVQAHGNQIIDYGDFDDVGRGGGILYVDVSESSATDDVPLYGEPEVEGNKLDFDPRAFGSTSTGDAVDITDGQLNFEFQTLPGAGVTSLFISEGGSFTFFGAGGSSIGIGYGLVARLTVLEVDGESIEPFTISANDSGSADQLNSPGISQEWDLSVFLELGPELLERQIPYEWGVTRGEVVIDNTLVSVSEDSTLAFIDKKDFMVEPGGDLTPDVIIPEPAAMALLLVGLLTGANSRRR